MALRASVRQLSILAMRRRRLRADRADQRRRRCHVESRGARGSRRRDQHRRCRAASGTESSRRVPTRSTRSRGQTAVVICDGQLSGAAGRRVGRGADGGHPFDRRRRRALHAGRVAGRVVRRRADRDDARRGGDTQHPTSRRSVARTARTRTTVTIDRAGPGRVAVGRQDRRGSVGRWRRRGDRHTGGCAEVADSWESTYARRLVITDTLALIWVAFGVQIAWFGLDSRRVDGSIRGPGRSATPPSRSSSSSRGSSCSRSTTLGILGTSAPGGEYRRIVDSSDPSVRFHRDRWRTASRSTSLAVTSSSRSPSACSCSC